MILFQARQEKIQRIEPFRKKTGVSFIDTVNVVKYKKFAEKIKIYTV